MRIGTTKRKSVMKISRTIVLALVPTLLAAAAVTPLHAQATENDAAFLQAAATGDVSLAQLLMRMGVDVNVVDSAGNTALMYAAGNGQVDMTAMLVETGASVNTVTPEGWTALMLAALGGYTPIVQGLIVAGADLSLKADIGMNALIMAAARGHAETVSALLDSGAKVDDPSPDGRTPLMGAAEQGHAEVVAVLLERGADPNTATPGGFTALLAAQNAGQTEVVWQLADAGAIFTSQLESLPELVSSPQLEVPDSLADAEITGAAVVEFVVDESGHVDPATMAVVSSPHPGLDEPVLALFRESVYNPGKYAGKAVRVKIRQSMTFGGEP
jgi:TonB family protein